MWLKKGVFMFQQKMDVKSVFLTKPAIKSKWLIVGVVDNEIY